MKKVSIIGAGLVGSLLSLYMAQRGYRVKVYERRPDMRKADITGGRSINLALSDRGIKALTEVGLIEDIRKMTIPMHGRLIHHPDGSTELQPYGLEGQYINSISRGGLNSLLMDKAEETANVSIEFEKKCVSYDFEKQEALFEDSQTDSDLIFATDGAFSAIRNSFEKTDRFNYQQTYLEHGYKELTIPAINNGDFQMEKSALHIWPRKNFMLIALPNIDGSFTVTLFLAFEGKYAFENLQTKEAVTEFFKEQFPDALPLMPTLLEDFFNNPTSSLVTIKCFPWSKGNKALLLGDAAHAIVPFYGQGMISGFEDCSILNSMIDEFKEDWGKIIPKFEKSRKPDADAISELALRNFIEMRDLVADEQFVLRKKIEKMIHKRHPDKFIPLYSMVTFSHIPYSKALELGKKHDAFFENTNLKDVLPLLNSEEGNNLLDRMAAELSQISNS